MRKSTITKHSDSGAGSHFALALGWEIRRRREASGLSQAAVAAPMGRAFLSLVEQGRVVPSLPSLLIVARRLDTSAGEILRSVELALEHD
jgi:transcriptional regulator with XRE-family HTH domain